MRNRVLLLGAACLCAVALWSDAGAAPEGVAVGDIRAVLSKTGTALRNEPSALSRAAASVAHGTRLRVTAVRGRWIQVTLVVGTEGASGGWLRSGETVEPFALTQKGRKGRVRVQDRAPSATEISASGRQFDPAVEASYRQEHPDLAPYYPLVDRLESVKPDPEAVRRFLLEGRLGRPAAGEGE